ncbi:Nucleosomal histone H3-Lys79 methylase [Coemansia sp. RSA 564]|nr:Nucleosomal histone H3-Lys79 methylase [Coemansia sp. RSA 564]
MDLFFGASTNASREQQSAKVRVEERPAKTPNASVNAPTDTSPTRRARPQQGDQTHKEDRRRSQQKDQSHSEERRRPQHDDRKRRRRLDEHRDERHTLKKLPTSESSRLSPRNSDLVNANRERVGSLPPSPRPRKSPVRAERKKPASSVAVSSLGQEIERCASVPVQASNVRRQKALVSAMPSPVDDREAGSDEPVAVVSSVDAVRQSESQYEDYFRWQDGEDRLQTIELHLPASGATESYSLLMPKSFDRESESRDEYLPVNDLISTVRAIALYLVDSSDFRHKVCGDKENGILRQLERARNRLNGRDFVGAVHEFNRLLDLERVSSNIGPVFDKSHIPSDLAIHIVEQTYNRVVAPTVNMLRQYKAFSNNVYGEILPTLVSEFIERAGISHDTTFIDLGCGIGNVVLQVAAQTGCFSCGIEIMKVPARFARRQAQEFEQRMRLYKLNHGAVQVWQGDFCESTDVQRMLPRADVVLVNNYAFDSALNQTLLQMFLDLKEGTKIISLKPFVTPDHKISARNIYSPESILTVRRYQYWSQCVSWTDSGGEYFVQTVDRSRLNEFLAQRGML